MDNGSYDESAAVTLVIAARRAHNEGSTGVSIAQGAIMQAQTVEQAQALERRRMSWEEYLALPDEIRAEWVDGEVVVSPTPNYRHQRSAHILAMLLGASLPDLFVVGPAGLQLPGNRLRIPDILVLDHEPETTWPDYPAVLVVEILSPSTRAEDTVRKAPEYLAGGAGQFWVVDPATRCLDVFSNGGDAWEPLAHLDDAAPRATVSVPPYGDVTVDLRDVLGAPLS